jgi:hypothetical protein
MLFRHVWIYLLVHRTYHPWKTWIFTISLRTTILDILFKFLLRSYKIPTISLSLILTLVHQAHIIQRQVHFKSPTHNLLDFRASTVYSNDEKNQLDATVIYCHKLTLHVSGIYVPIFRSTGCNLLHVAPHAVSYNLYSWRWAYKCSKHVELFYDNKLHLLHQVGSSRHWYIRCTVTHTSNLPCIY